MATQVIYDSLTKGEAIIYVDECITDNALAGLKRCIEKGQIDPSKFDKAHIYYDCLKGLDLNPEYITGHYPLMFIDSKNGRYVHVSGVTAGYGGTGPHGTLKCLEIMGFELSEEEKKSVLTKKKLPSGDEDPIVCLEFNK